MRSAQKIKNLILKILAAPPQDRDLFEQTAPPQDRGLFEQKTDMFLLPAMADLSRDEKQAFKNFCTTLEERLLAKFPHLMTEDAGKSAHADKEIIDIALPAGEYIFLSYSEMAFICGKLYSHDNKVCAEKDVSKASRYFKLAMENNEDYAAVSYADTLLRLNKQSDAIQILESHQDTCVSSKYLLGCVSSNEKLITAAAMLGNEHAMYNLALRSAKEKPELASDYAKIFVPANMAADMDHKIALHYTSVDSLKQPIQRTIDAILHGNYDGLGEVGQCIPIIEASLDYLDEMEASEPCDDVKRKIIDYRGNLDNFVQRQFDTCPNILAMTDFQANIAFNLVQRWNNSHDQSRTLLQDWSKKENLDAEYLQIFTKVATQSPAAKYWLSQYYFNQAKLGKKPAGLISWIGLSRYLTESYEQTGARLLQESSAKGCILAKTDLVSRQLFAEGMKANVRMAYSYSQSIDAPPPIDEAKAPYTLVCSYGCKDETEYVTTYVDVLKNKLKTATNDKAKDKVVSLLLNVAGEYTAIKDKALQIISDCYLSEKGEQWKNAALSGDKDSLKKLEKYATLDSTIMHSLGDYWQTLHDSKVSVGWYDSFWGVTYETKAKACHDKALAMAVGAEPVVQQESTVVTVENNSNKFSDDKVSGEPVVVPAVQEPETTNTHSCDTYSNVSASLAGQPEPVIVATQPPPTFGSYRDIRGNMVEYSLALDWMDTLFAKPYTKVDLNDLGRLCPKAPTHEPSSNTDKKTTETTSTRVAILAGS